MQPMLNELRHALEAQLSNLEELEQVLQAQRQLLVVRDVSSILECVQQQGDVVERIRAMEDQRRSMIAKLATDLGLNSDATLLDVSQRLQPVEARDMLALRQQLRQRLEAIRKLNRDNQRLIAHRLDVVQDMIAALAGAPPTQRTYEASGQLKQAQQLKSVMDHKT